MTTIATFPIHTIQTKYFSLSIQHKKQKTDIVMRLLGEKVNTREIPSTVMTLQKLLPNVFTSQCFNDRNVSFLEEAEETELGHLFEHILLEYLCDYKSKIGFKNVVFSGVTFWDWRKSPRGTFTITVDSTSEDRFIFSKALKKTIGLVEVILSEKTYTEKRRVYPILNTAINIFAISPTGD